MSNEDFKMVLLFKNTENYMKILCLFYLINNNRRYRFITKLREVHPKHPFDHDIWLKDYIDTEFYKLFRMRKATFYSLLHVILDYDEYSLLKKKYRGGHFPIVPEKSLLIFIWYISTQDTLLAIGDRIGIVSSTVMQIINNLLYIILSLRNKYIVWPKTEEEFEFIGNGFRRYPGVIGAVDGTHIPLKVPTNQHDSYINRHQQHSINLMAVCNADKVFTYVFVGFPGSAHDSRVFSNSILVQNIERYGANKYFKDCERYHLVGDSAFPIKQWLMTPYKENHVLNQAKYHHNHCLSGARICIEHAFGLLKSRWRRLAFINTYSVCKAIEITTTTCILHNFCILSTDDWAGTIEEENYDYEYVDLNRQQQQLGIEKRERICRNLQERD